MNIYRIKKIRNSEYCCVIFSLSYINPLERWADIEKELYAKKLRGLVLIDLFVTNGSENRFFCLNFDGKHIVASSMASVEIVSDELRALLSKFYCKHINLINKLSITNESVFKLTHCHVL